MTPCQRKRRTAVRKGHLSHEKIVEHFKDTNNCYICGCTVSDTAMQGSEFKKEYDHIVPLSKGGQHKLTNLAVCCKYCNRLKADKALSTMDIGNDHEYDYMDWGE